MRGEGERKDLNREERVAKVSLGSQAGSSETMPIVTTAPDMPLSATAVR